MENAFAQAILNVHAAQCIGTYPVKGYKHIFDVLLYALGSNIPSITESVASVLDICPSITADFQSYILLDILYLKTLMVLADGGSPDVST